MKVTTQNMNTHDVFPVPNSTQSYWRSQLHEIDSIRSTDELPKECDILIIGAGLSGVSTAYHLLDDNPSPSSIVLLEAREVCSGATGRNGGHLAMSQATVTTIAQKYGIDAARELVLFQQNQVYTMKVAVDKEKLDCDAVLTRYMEAYLVQSHADEAKQMYDKQLAAGYDFMRDVTCIKPEYVDEVSGIKDAKLGLTTTALQLWPYKFVTSLLARLLERTSINVQTHTCVTSIYRSKDGITTVTTPRGAIRAKKVVFATNGYTAGIAPQYTQKITPLRGTCSHISIPKDTAHHPPHLNHTYGLNFGPDGNRDYIIPRPDGGVICGGAKSTFINDRKLYENNWDDSTLIEPARAHFETVMQKNFRGWEKSGAGIDYLWTGIMGYTADGLPHCGKVPGQENHFILAGYNGGGMSLIFLTAKGIAKMITDDVPFEESGIPKLFKTTEERLKKDV